MVLERIEQLSRDKAELQRDVAFLHAEHLRAKASRERILKVILVFVMVLVLTAWGIGFAAPGDPVTFSFTSGEVISSGQVNQNFTDLIAQTGELQIRVSALEALTTVDVGGETISVIGVLCGETAATTGNLFNSGTGSSGITAARELCQTTCGSTTAHMCSGHEASISSQLGLFPTTGAWINAMASNGSDGDTNCTGWTSASGAQRGQVWGANGQSTQGLCDNATVEIACCDFN